MIIMFDFDGVLMCMCNNYDIEFRCCKKGYNVYVGVFFGVYLNCILLECVFYVLLWIVLEENLKSKRMEVNILIIWL